MANTHRVTVIVLLVGMLALTGTCQTAAQTPFPIGLQLKYVGEYASGGQAPQSYTYEYEALSWATSIGPGVLQARERDNLYQTSWATVYHHNTTWRVYDAGGVPTDNYVFPPFWVAVGGLQQGGNIDFRTDGGTTTTLAVTSGHHVVVAAGDYTCWETSYSYSDPYNAISYAFFYESRVGILVKVQITMDLIGTTLDLSEVIELSESNFENFILSPPNLLPLLLLAGGGVIAVVAAIAIIVVVLKRRAPARTSPPVESA